MTDCISQATFSFLEKLSVRISFDGGQMTGDGGLPLIRQIDDHSGLTKRFANALVEWRNTAFITHAMHDFVRSRTYAIVAGHEDGNDLSRLREDPLLKACCDRLQGDAALPSQPSISRFENNAARGGVAAARRVLLDHYVQKWKRRLKRPTRVTLDVDTTDDPTHGQQEFAAFNGQHGYHCYRELFIYTEEGDLLFAELMPGTGDLRRLALQAVEEVVTYLREQWPGAHFKLKLRADNGFAGPELYDFCEDNGIEYLVNAGTYAHYEKHAAPLLERAKALYEAGGEQATAQAFGEFLHQGKDWRCPRRIVIRAQHTIHGPDARFVITNSERPCHEVYLEYVQRGQNENWIKDIKRGMKADRLSASDFAANQLRLLLIALAYQLAHELRQRASERLRTARIETLRNAVLKVPAIVKQTARNLWVRASETWPWRAEYLQLAAAVGAAVG